MFTAAIRAALTSGGSTSKGEKLLQLCRRVLSSSSLTSRESQPEELEDHKWESPGIKQDVLNEDNPDPRDFLSYFVTHGEGFKTSLNAYNSSRVADQYDKSLLAVSYSGHQICADIVAGVTSQHPDRSQVKVIDVCAGTGVIGKALHQRGFRDLTAHDGAQAMVDFCQSTGAYNQFLCCALNDLGSLPFADNSFDIATAAGAFVDDHVPSSGLAELARVVKSGGFVINVYRDGVLQTEYGQTYAEFLAHLEASGVWQKYGRLQFPKYNYKADGMVDVFQVC